MKYLKYFIVFPVAAWIRYFMYYRKWKKENELEIARLDHEKRHNCVVTYSPIIGCKGYIEPTAVLPRSLEYLHSYLDPILYFLNTAKTSIDIAIMAISIDEIFPIIISKVKEGVTIRILVDYDSMISNQNLKSIKEAGAIVLMFKGYNSIMHYKFAVKDYDPKGSGYLLIGSMNWTERSLYEHYDHIVFTSVKNVVQNYHDAFQDTWDLIIKNNHHHI